ncbi:MAG: FecR domain-containing protein [Chitinophagaceae bacterium]|nr:FecR domain-containing protein [Chitinophagaceae bacterium]
MNDHLSRVSELIIKHLEGGLLTAQEQQELDAWLEASPQNKTLLPQLTDPDYVREALQQMHSYNAEAGWQKIQSAYTTVPAVVPVRHSSQWKYWVAAAAILFAVAGAALLYLYFPGKTTPIATTKAAQPAKDIPAPAISKATITLQNGKRISVDSLTIGTIDLQEKTAIKKTADGQIVYTGNEASTAQMYFNTLTNPRGSKVIQLTLSDGTKVWLNTESEIRYPVAFTGTSREVEMKGEAYFEVAKDAAKPFMVKSNGTTVEVTGTHFNINAYSDEASLNISLLEGGVKVSKGSNTVALTPGEQAQVNEKIKIDAHADMEQVMAWKNGSFSFKGEDIYTTMRQLSRWYNVDIQFKEAVSEKFYGDISRDKNISSVLKKLETTGGVHFKTIENRIEVYK